MKKCLIVAGHILRTFWATFRSFWQKDYRGNKNEQKECGFCCSKKIICRMMQFGKLKALISFTILSTLATHIFYYC